MDKPVVEVKEEDWQDVRQASPMYRVCDVLVRVAEGGSMVEVIRTVVDAIPDTREEARVFLEQLQRLKGATERVYAVAQESIVTKFR